MSDVLDDREYTINILLFWSNFLFYLSVPFHCTVSPLIEWCFGRQRVHTHTDLKQFVCRTIHSFEQMTRHLEGLLFLCLMHRHCLRCGVDSSISMSWLQGGHSSVQFSSRWYQCTHGSLDVLLPISEKFHQCCLQNCSFQCTLLNASSHEAVSVFLQQIMPLLRTGPFASSTNSTQSSHKHHHILCLCVGPLYQNVHRSCLLREVVAKLVCLLCSEQYVLFSSTGLPKGPALGSPCLPQHGEWSHASWELLPAGSSIPRPGRLRSGLSVLLPGDTVLPGQFCAALLRPWPDVHLQRRQR